ncbi:MAG: hypothetical protein AAFZ91_07265 [Pseudomonadota bacterium]
MILFKDDFASRLTITGLVALTGGCQAASLAAGSANYERTLDRYEQTDTTQTDVTNTEHEDGRRAALLSAFYGLDDAVSQPADRLACEGAGGADGMPVIFSHEVDVTTLDPGDFRITTASGDIGEIVCLTLAPADDEGELRTVLLTGAYGSLEDQPVTVETVGNILSLDNTINFKGLKIDVTPLEDGPSLVWAETVAPRDWDLGGAGTSFGWGGGSKCPIGTAQIVRVAWGGGITKPGGAPAGDAERQLYQVTVRTSDGTQAQITPFALADLNDRDNNHLLCLDTLDKAVSVSFPAGHVTDPREDLNPASSVMLAH